MSDSDRSAGHDASDINQPEPPNSNPTAADMDMDDMGDGMSDNDSVLSDVDEAQFEDFDPANVTIEERPAIMVDEENIKLIGRHKRKRDGDAADGEGEEKKKKKKEGKRDRKSKKKKDSDDGFSGGEELEGKRRRKKAAPGEGGEKRERTKRAVTPENEEDLDPETREYLALLCTSRLHCWPRLRSLSKTDC